jgi:hypothetical protein
MRIQVAEKAEMNVVFLGVSTSQTISALPIAVVLAAFSLLALAVLLWKNHRDSVRSSGPVVVLVESGTLCPVDLVARLILTIPVRTPARAPPTFHSLSIGFQTPGTLRSMRE